MFRATFQPREANRSTFRGLRRMVCAVFTQAFIGLIAEVKLLSRRIRSSKLAILCKNSLS